MEVTMSIKIVFHEDYFNCQYATDPAAAGQPGAVWMELWK